MQNILPETRFLYPTDRSSTAGVTGEPDARESHTDSGGLCRYGLCRGSMVEIDSVEAVPVTGGFFFDDQQAIKGGAERDGFDYRGEPVTDGFDRIRQPAEALSVLVTLASGQVAVGDCASVQYAGAGGRDRAFRASRHRSTVTDHIAPALEGRDAASFERNVEELSGLEGPLHTAVRYGVSQALLDAASKARNVTMTDILARMYDREPAREPIPLYTQSGDRRRENSEKMILKGVERFPHGLFNNVEKVGEEGERLTEFIRWLARRVDDIGPANYEPTFHVDVYGTLGDSFGPPYDRAEVTSVFADFEAAAGEYDLQLEGPMDAGSRSEQIRAMRELREGLAEAGVGVDIVADEWCDTVDDVRAFVDAGAADVVQVKTPDLGGIHRSAEAVCYASGTDVDAYLGGSCAETDVSARASAHVALATEPIQVLAKPGMGVDEGITIVRNEMLRTIAMRRRRTDHSDTDY